VVVADEASGRAAAASFLPKLIGDFMARREGGSGGGGEIEVADSIASGDVLDYWRVGLGGGWEQRAAPLALQAWALFAAAPTRPPPPARPQHAHRRAPGRRRGRPRPARTALFRLAAAPR
jgi:hypothetical protein